MTVQRSDSATRPEQTQRSQETDRRPKADNDAPPRERVDQFRSMMQQARGETGKKSGDEALLKNGMLDGERMQAQTATEQAVQAANARSGRQHQQRDSDPMELFRTQGMESAAMLQAQIAMRDGSTMAAPQQVANTNAGQLFDMMQKHVRQLAANDANAPGASDGQVLLRMADATLPGTDLLLTKSADGWVLRADSRSRDSFDAIREAGPQLAKRFAEQNLGKLTIDTHYHG